MKYLLLSILLLPLGVLAEVERIPYTCDNGSRIDISFFAENDGRPQATLHFADESLTLPQVPAASGALYRQDGISLHTQGQEALFTDNKGNSRRCTQGVAPAKPAPAASSFIDLSGSVTYLARIALPPDAVLIIEVRDTPRAGRPLVLAEQRIELAGHQVPVAFATAIDRDLIGKKARITVAARIESGGKAYFVSNKAYPALKNGNPFPLAITLKPVRQVKNRQIHAAPEQPPAALPTLPALPALAKTATPEPATPKAALIPGVVCHITYGGETRHIEARPTDSPYSVAPVAIGSYFLFRIVLRTEPADLAGIKLYTYADHTDGPAIVHQASYAYPANNASSHGFSGLNFVYEPLRDGELEYWCEVMTGEAK